MVRLTVELDEDGSSGPEDLEEAARALREELLELDVDGVERPSRPAPDGARAIEAAILGTLLVTLSKGALAAVAGTIQNWVARGGVRTVTLELDGDRIELGNASAEDQRRLLEAFVARHGGE
ncbi:MAG: hypothetical protein QOE28_1575 [Solirubrobacteraceae bacterium]|nr:hypothetical protein [Solirubrobacteraceae bacterium]